MPDNNTEDFSHTQWANNPFGPKPVHQSMGNSGQSKIDEAVLRATNTAEGGVTDGSFSLF
jgi:hypothetical protein